MKSSAEGPTEVSADGSVEGSSESLVKVSKSSVNVSVEG